MRFILAKLGLGDSRNDKAVRTLSLATLISTFGNGLFVTVEVIYFTQIVGLSAILVALALGVAGAVSLLFTVPAGQLADRYGARVIGVVAFVGEGLALLGLVFVHSFWPFLILNAIIAIFGTAGHTAQSTLIARMGEGEERVKIRAAQRAISNVGLGIGTIFAGFALAINDPIGYQLMLVLDFLTFIAAAIAILKLPKLSGTIEKGEPFSFIALKDKRYLTATFLNGIMSLHFVLQNVAIPLWIVQETNAPRWWVSVLFIVNTVLVASFQVRASSGTGDLLTSAKKFRSSGFYIALACVVYGFAGGIPLLAASVVLVLAMIIHSIGELLSAAGSWSIGFDLAEEKHQGQYQGVYSLGRGLGGTFGPLYVTSMAIGLGMLGWWVMGLVFALTGIAMYYLVRQRVNQTSK